MKKFFTILLIVAGLLTASFVGAAVQILDDKANIVQQNTQLQNAIQKTTNLQKL